jgi:hypothetical protein
MGATPAVAGAVDTGTTARIVSRTRSGQIDL